MRGHTILMLLLCASVFTSIGYFVWNGQSPMDALEWARTGFRSSRMGPVQMQFEPPPEKVKASARPRNSKSQTTIVQTKPEPEVVVAPPPPPPPPKPQPTAADVLIGLSRSELLSKFAPPSLQMNSVNGGDVIEEMYYSRKDNPKPTVISLRNGVVTHVTFAPGSTGAN